MSSADFSPICKHFFLKGADIVLVSRSPGDAIDKMNTDFNLTTPESSTGRSDADNCFMSTRTMYIDVVTDGDAASTITQGRGASPRTNSKYAVMERWCIRVEGNIPLSASSVNVARFYKRLIILTRTLYTFTRFLPLYRVVKHNTEVTSQASPLTPPRTPGAVPLHTAVFDALGPASTAVFDGVSSKLMEFDTVEVEGMRICLSVRYRDDVTPPTATGAPLAPGGALPDSNNPAIIQDFFSTPPKRVPSIGKAMDRRASVSGVLRVASGSSPAVPKIPLSQTQSRYEARAPSLPMLIKTSNQDARVVSRSAPISSPVTSDSSAGHPDSAGRLYLADADGGSGGRSRDSPHGYIQNTPPFGTTPPAQGPWTYAASPSSSPGIAVPHKMTISPTHQGSLRANLTPGGGFMQPQRPTAQSRVRSRGMSMESNIAQVLKIGQSKNLSTLSSELGIAQTTPTLYDSEDAFVDDDAGLLPPDAFGGDHSTDLTISTLVRRCEVPPELESAGQAPVTLPTLLKELERLQQDVIALSSLTMSASPSSPRTPQDTSTRKSNLSIALGGTP